MGPQLYRCGNQVHNSTLVFTTSELQWGRNFIVAETTKRALNGMGQWTASMGPQLYRCGNRERLDAGVLPHRASMGPQLYRCGNSESDAKFIIKEFSFNGAATLSLRKPWNELTGSADIDMLQWGRNFIVAETRPRRAGSGGLRGLQWGRNFIVAETWTCKVRAPAS